MDEWISGLQAAAMLGMHFHCVYRLARSGELVARKGAHPPGKKSPWEFSRASVEERRDRMNRLPPAPEADQWMPIAEAQAALKMTRHGIKRRIRLGLLESTHYGFGQQAALYVNRRQVEEQAQKAPDYVRRTHWEAPPVQELDRAWFAGFFDGEGCVCLRKHPVKQHIHWYIEICVPNTCFAPLDYAAERIGGRVHTRCMSDGIHKDIRAWTATAAEAVAILRAIRPYLRVKHRQADLAIEFQQHIESVRYGRWNPMPQEERDWRQQQWEKMRALNRRGVAPERSSDPP